MFTATSLSALLEMAMKPTRMGSPALCPRKRMLAESGAWWLCWMVQPTMAPSRMVPARASNNTLAVGGPSAAMLLSISQVPMWMLRISLSRTTTPPPPL